MHLALVLAVLATYTIAENAPGHSVSHAVGRLVLVLGGVGVVVLLATVVSRGTVHALRTDLARRRQLLRDFHSWQQIHIGFWLCVVLCIEYAMQWPQLVRVNWGLGSLWLVDELVILAPLVLPLVLSWAAYFDVDLAADVAGQSQAWSFRPAERSAYVLVQARHYLGLILLPVLMLLAVRDLDQLQPLLAVPVHYRWTGYAAVIVGLVLAFPWFLRLIWATERLPEGPLRSRLESSAQRFGITFRDILVWKTGMRAVNAAVAGFLPWSRYVFLTDGLLNQLNDDDIEAVFAHEVGHIRQHHMARRMLAVLLPACLWLIVDTSLRMASMPIFESAAQTMAAMGMAGPALSVLAMSLYLALTLAWYSRLLERQADLWACRQLSGNDRSVPSSSGSSVAAYVCMLEKLRSTQPADGRRGGWLHPSLQARIDFLNDVAADLRHERMFRRQIGLAGVILVLAASAPLLLLWMS